MKKILKSIPYATLAATGYLIANLTLTFQGIIEGNQLIPPFYDLKILDSSAWQSVAGLLWIIVALNIYMVQKFPHGAILFNAFLNLLANTALLISGYNQEAFAVHAVGLIPGFIAVALMFQGNKINEKKGIYSRYPVACAAGLFLIAAPPLFYNAILSHDWTLTFVLSMWCISHVLFALTDQNFYRKLFGEHINK